MFNFISTLYKNLTTDNGRFSHTRFWSNIAYTVATIVIIHLSLVDRLTENYFVIYLGVVASHASVSKWITATKESK